MVSPTFQNSIILRARLNYADYTSLDDRDYTLPLEDGTCCRSGTNNRWYCGSGGLVYISYSIEVQYWCKNFQLLYVNDLSSHTVCGYCALNEIEPETGTE